MRLHYFVHPDESKEHENGSIIWIKKMIKQFGGSGYTIHMERDGTVFETTEIKITGNNSNHKYNHHL